MSGVVYAQKHQNCLEYANEKTALFNIVSLKKGDEIPPIENNQSALYYIFSGNLEITLKNFDKPYFIDKPTLLFSSKSHQLQGRAIEDCKYAICIAPIGLPLCSRYDLVSLRKEEKYRSTPFYPSRIGMLLPIDRIEVFFAELERSLTDGMNCIHYHELKQKELFILLRAYYGNESLYDFLHPLIGMDDSFRDFIYQNYKRAGSVGELAALANMSVRNFQRHFKAEFSCSARDWLLEHRIDVIRQELYTTQKDFNTIAFENGFSSVAYFSTFCKQHLGNTPSNLRTNYQTKHKNQNILQ